MHMPTGISTRRQMQYLKDATGWLGAGPIVNALNLSLCSPVVAPDRQSERYSAGDDQDSGGR